MPRQPTDPISALVLRMATITPGERVLLLHIDSPGVARWAIDNAQPGGRVIALHASYRVLNRFARVPGLVTGDTVYPDPTAHGPADAALLSIPKGRDHIRAYLWTAAQTLRPGGRLYVVGDKAGGAKSAISDTAVIFGAAPVLGHKAGHRIALATRPETLDLPPDWAESAPWQPQARTIARPEGVYTIVTMPGVFSWDHLDDGTALLLDHLGVKPDTDVLDLGCGCGIIGLAAARSGACVALTDDSLLAVRCARASLAANELTDRCAVLPGDVTGAVRDQRFDLILSNPPFHQGIDVTTGITARFVREGFGVLRPGGRLRIVANRFLPYDRLMQQTFGNATTIADTGRYRVLESARAR